MSTEPRTLWRPQLWGICDSLLCVLWGMNAPSPSTVTAIANRVIATFGDEAIEAAWRLGGQRALAQLARAIFDDIVERHPDWPTHPGPGDLPPAPKEKP